MEEVLYWSQWEGANGSYQLRVIGIDRAQYGVFLYRWQSYGLILSTYDWGWEQTLYDGNNFQQAMNTASEFEYKTFRLNGWTQVGGSTFNG